MTTETPTPDALKGSREDEVLVRECLSGNREAWSALIGKYKKLIFSIPIKYGFSTEDSTEIFQAVCVTLLSDLSQLREPRALAAWIIRATAHKCWSFRRDQRKYGEAQVEELETESVEKLPDTLLQELEREQLLREAIREQAPECKRLIELLFFSNPPIPYAEAARALGMAKGSIGATRIRCLEKLRRALEKREFPYL